MKSYRFNFDAVFFFFYLVHAFFVLLKKSLLNPNYKDFLKYSRSFILSGFCPISNEFLFIVWGKGRCVFFFPYGFPIFQDCLSPLPWHLCQNCWSIYDWIYFWTCCVLLIYMSIFTLILQCLELLWIPSLKIIQVFHCCTSSLWFWLF